MYEYPQARRARRRPSQTRSAAGPWREPGAIPTAVAILEDRARSELDLATADAFKVLHVDTVAEAIRTTRSNGARAILLSPVMLKGDSSVDVQRLIASCPGVQTIVVQSRQGPLEPHALLQLGAVGVWQVVDLREAGEYERLRTLVTAIDPVVTGRILDAVLASLASAHERAQRFFAVLIQSSPDIPTARGLASILRIGSSTLMSRFFRSGLPSPKEYLAHARLTHAAAYFEMPHRSIADVAYRLRYSSPQSFGRHVYGMLGVTAGEFRRSMTFDAAIQGLRKTMFDPYLEIFKRFDPTGT